MVHIDHRWLVVHRDHMWHIQIASPERKNEGMKGREEYGGIWREVKMNDAQRPISSKK